MPISTNEAILGAHMQHAVVVEMYNRRFNLRVQNILSQSDRAVQNAIRTGNLTRIDSLVSDITRKINGAYDEVNTLARKELSRFVGNEVDFNNNLLKRQVGDVLKVKRVLPQEIRKAVIGSTLDVGTSPRSFTGHIKSLAKKEIRQVRAGVRQALTLGLSEKQAVKFIYDNPKFAAPNRLTRPQVRTLVRTSLTEVQSNAALRTFQANSGIIEFFKYTATLDDRTTPICQRLDGLIQPTRGGVIPPQHYNCRSIIIPVVKKYSDIPSGSRKGVAPAARRASMNGQVPAVNNYNDWLAAQPEVVQNSILGVAQAVTFRQGLIEIKQMIAQDGRPLSVSAARRVDNDIIAGRTPQILRVESIKSLLTTPAQFRNGANQPQINKFFKELGEDTKSNYGTAHLIKKNPGKTYYDPEIKKDVQAFVRSYDEQLLLDQLKRSQGAVTQKAIKQADYDWIINKAKYLSRIGQMNVHQEIVFINLMTRRFANMRGYIGSRGVKGIRGSGWKKNATIAQETADEPVSEWLLRLSNNADGAVRGRARDIIQNESVSIASILDVKKWGDGITRFEAALARKANRPEIYNRVDDVLRDTLDVSDLSNIQLKEIAEIVTLELARGSGLRTDTVSAAIGRRLADRFRLDADGQGLLMQIRLGARFIEEFQDVLNYRVLSKGREYQFGQYVENIILSPTTADKSSWINYSRNLQRQTKYINQPNTKGKLATAEVGKTVDSLGRKLISSNPDDLTITELPRQWFRTYKTRQALQFEIDNDVFTGLKVLAKYNPELLRKGGFSDSGIITQKWGKLVEVVDINKARKFGYNHFFDYRGRIYVRNDGLSYNGSPLEKALHLNVKKTKWLDADVDDNFERFWFEAAEYLGSQTVRINGIDRLVSINSELGRLTIFEAHRTRMLTLGNAVLKGNEAEIRSASQYLKTFKNKNVPGVLKASVEYARMEAHRASRGSYRGYNSGYRVGQDATASGPQLASMLLEDAGLAKATNVIPTIRNGVQVKRTPYLDDVSPDVVASDVWRRNRFLRELDEDDRTALFKSPTMTSLYNISRGTLNPAERRGILGQVRKSLADIADEVNISRLISDDELIELANTVAISIRKNLPGVYKLTRFTDKLTRATTNAITPLRYTTPFTGVEIIYGARKARYAPFEYTINGITRVYNQPIYGDTLVSSRAAFKAPPTIIHSIDADGMHWLEREAARLKFSLQSNHDALYTNVQDADAANLLYKRVLIMLQESNFLKRMIDDAWDRRAFTGRPFKAAYSKVNKKGKLVNYKAVEALSPRQQYKAFLDELESISPRDLGEYADALLSAVWPIS